MIEKYSTSEFQAFENQDSKGNIHLQTNSTAGAPNSDRFHQLELGLKNRSIRFLALGGAIGTEIFVGSGAILHMVGPAQLVCTCWWLYGCESQGIIAPVIDRELDFYCLIE